MYTICMAFEVERPPEYIPHPCTGLDIGEIVCQAVAASEGQTAMVAEAQNGVVYNLRSWPITAPAEGEEDRTLRIMWDRDEWEPGTSPKEILERPIGVHIQDITYLGSRLGLPWTRHSVVVHNPTGPSYGLQTEFLFDTLRRPNFAVALPFYFEEDTPEVALRPVVSWAFMRACGINVADRDATDLYTAAAVSPLTQEDCSRLSDDLFIATVGNPTSY